jgi:hypothetical protein
MTNHLPPELPELHELPKLPPRVYVAYVLSVCAALAVAGAGLLAGFTTGEPWAFFAALGFVLLGVSQALAYLWRSEAWEAHTMAVALSRAVAWIYSDERPEL